MIASSPLLRFLLPTLALSSGALGCLPELQERLQLDTDRVLAHGAREYASAGALDVVDTLAERFREVGADVSEREVWLPVLTVREATLELAGGAGAPDVTAEALAFAGDGTVSATLVDVGDGKASSYTADEVDGRVALIRSTPTSSLLFLYDLAVRRGAAAVVWDSDTDGEDLRQRRTAWKPDGHGTPRGPIPGVSIAGATAARVRSAMGEGEVTATVTTSTTIDRARARSVFGRYSGTAHPGETIVINAHLDSWHTGANDNATALAVLVELGRRLQEQPLAYDVVLAAFPGQEIGFFGSSQYVRDTSDDVVLALTLDMLAPMDPSLRLAAFDPFRFDTAPSALLEAFDTSGMTDLFDLQMPASELRTTVGSVTSDQASFWDDGIPGVFLACIGWPGYHTAADVPEIVNWPRLVSVTDALWALLVELSSLSPIDLGAPPLAWLDVTAEWREGTAAATVTPALDGTTVQALATATDTAVVIEAPFTEVGAGAWEVALDPGEAEWLRVHARTAERSGVSWVRVEP